jgi:lipoprotein-anchoring transpeptidase ErfK/SrfK
MFFKKLTTLNSMKSGYSSRKNAREGTCSYHFSGRSNPVFLLFSGAAALFFLLQFFHYQPVQAQPVSMPAEPALAAKSTPTPATLDPSQPVTNKTFAALFAHSWDIPVPVSQADFWIEVDLSAQKLHAYQGGTLLQSFSISSGTSKYPTLPGEFKVYAKYTRYTMRGPGYYLPDVPFSMFFFKGYSIHGTYWHRNFGTPMSHGCVNMETSAAEWLYGQAQIGTRVFVHN